MQPWIRMGYFRGSADTNPNDSRHTTFFQVLSSPACLCQVSLLHTDERRGSVCSVQTGAKQEVGALLGSPFGSP
jgi:hypothetical protein